MSHALASGKPRTPAPPDGPGPRPDEEFSATERLRCREPASPRRRRMPAAQRKDSATMTSSAAAKRFYYCLFDFIKQDQTIV